MTITYGQLMSSLLIFKCNMLHGTMKYTLKAHFYYFVFMAWLLHYLYSLHPDSYTLENIINIETQWATSLIMDQKFWNQLSELTHIIHQQTLLLLLLYNIYIAHYITITLSASHYKTIKIIQDTNWYEVKIQTKQK